MNTDIPSSPLNKKRWSRTILVVGNKTREMLSISLLLRQFDYEVATASTAPEALELVSIAVPALIISEMVLPGISGMDLMHLLHQERRTAAVPVVFVVPLSDAAAETRCRHAGAACITKPIMAEALYRIVQQAIEPRPRENLRIETRVAVSLNNVPLDGGDGKREINLSEHGMYVHMEQPYPRNRRLFVQMNIRDRLISVEGAVLYSHAFAVGPHKYPGMGLKFINIAPQDRDFIRRFIHDEIDHSIASALPPAPVNPW